MNRELKVKAWLKDSKCMAEVRQISFFNGSTVVKVYDEPMGEEIWFDLDDLVLLQYTGLKDKNSVEIFEGDIVTSKNYPFQDEGKYNYHGVVEWDENIAAFIIVKRLVNSSRRGISEGIADSMEGIKYFEVIGNIYENTKLLEVK